MRNKRLVSTCILLAALCTLTGCQNREKDVNDILPGNGTTAASTETTVTSEDGKVGYEYSSSEIPISSGIPLAECVKLPEWRGLELEKYTVSVSDQSARDYALDALVEYSLLGEDEPAQLGDTAQVSYVGTIDGVAFEGGTAEDTYIILGTGNYIDGFEDAIVGMKIGEEKDATITFPEDYGVADVAGKEAVFHFTVKSINRPAEPTEEQLAEARRILEENEENNSQRVLENSAWSKIEEGTVLYYIPEEYVRICEAEYDAEILSRASSVDEYLEMYGLKKEDYEEDKALYGRNQGKYYAVIDEFAAELGIKEGDKQYMDELGSLTIRMGLNQEELEEKYGKPQVLYYVYGKVIIGEILKEANILIVDTDGNEVESTEDDLEAGSEEVEETEAGEEAETVQEETSEPEDEPEEPVETVAETLAEEESEIAAEEPATTPEAVPEESTEAAPADSAPAEEATTAAPATENAPESAPESTPAG